MNDGDETSWIPPFQNISCLRLIQQNFYQCSNSKVFQNISCLRLIRSRHAIHRRSREISKHFMFTVNGFMVTLGAWARMNFKTFHVYG